MYYLVLIDHFIDTTVTLTPFNRIKVGDTDCSIGTIGQFIKGSTDSLLMMHCIMTCSHKLE